MVKRVIVMRHCKSSWDHPGLRDHDRPLNMRGTKSAEALGQWLRDTGYLPDIALVSTSLRTRETFVGLGLACEVRYLPELYHAEAETMLQTLAECQADCVLMIAHNPGIADFAARILSQRVSHERFWDYPTGATLVADFPDTIGFGKANARDFVIPRELMA